MSTINGAASSSSSASSQHLAKIIRILSRPQMDRSPADKRLLLELTKDIKFFQQYEDHPFVHENCCCYMSYEFHAEGETVFQINTIGDKFYVILEGTVGVYIQNECEGQEDTHSTWDIPIFNTPLSSTIESNLSCVKCLSKGNSFGELALLYDSPRMASIVCHTDCHFAVLPKKEFLRVMKNEQKDKLNKKLQYLQTLSVFQRMNPQLLRQIYSKAFYISTTKDQYVYKQGQPTDHFFFVRHGEFAVKKHSIEESDEVALGYQLNEENNQKNPGIRRFSCIEKNLGLFGPLIRRNKQHDLQLSLLVEPDYFGEEDLIWGNSKRSFSVQCMTAEGEVIMIQKALFMQILTSPDTRNFLEQHLEIKEKQFHQRIENAKVQFEKFKGYLLEDRKGSWQEDKERSEKRDNNSSTSNKNQLKSEQFSLSRQDLRDKNIIAPNAQVIDAESQRILEEKIIHFIQERYQQVSANRKAQVPSFQEIREHNEKYQAALRMKKSSQFIIIPSEKKQLTDQSQKIHESSYSPSKPPTPHRSLLAQLQKQMLLHSQTNATDKSDHSLVSSLSSYFHKNPSLSPSQQLSLEVDTPPFLCSSLNCIKQHQPQKLTCQTYSNFFEPPPQSSQNDLLQQEQQSSEFVSSPIRKTSIKFFESPRRDLSTGLLTLRESIQPTIVESHQDVEQYEQHPQQQNQHTERKYTNMMTSPQDSPTKRAVPSCQSIRSFSLESITSRQRSLNNNSPQKQFVLQILNRRLVKQTAKGITNTISTRVKSPDISQENTQNFLISNIQSTASKINNSLTRIADSTNNSSVAEATTTAREESRATLFLKRRGSLLLKPSCNSSNISYCQQLPSSFSPIKSPQKISSLSKINNTSFQIQQQSLSYRAINRSNRMDLQTNGKQKEQGRSFQLIRIKTEGQTPTNNENPNQNTPTIPIIHSQKALGQVLLSTNGQDMSRVSTDNPLISPTRQKMSIRFQNIFRNTQHLH